MRPDRFPRYLSRPALLSTHELRMTRATIKPVRSDDGQVRLASLRELQSPEGDAPQSATGDELRPLLGRTLMPSVLDRAFKGEL